MGDVFLIIFTNYIAPILGSMIMIILIWAVKKLADKLGLDLEKEQMEIIEETARKFVIAAEEKTAGIIKHTGDTIDEKNPRIDKMADVVAGLLQKFPKLTAEEAERIANAAVSKIHGIGATNLE